MSDFSPHLTHASAKRPASALHITHTPPATKACKARLTGLKTAAKARFNPLFLIYNTTGREELSVRANRATAYRSGVELRPFLH